MPVTKTLWTSLGMSALAGIAFGGEFWLIAPPPADQLTLVQCAASAAIVTTISMVFMPFAIISGRKQAAHAVATVNRMSAFALANFDRLAEGEGESKLITHESLTKLLRDPSISDDERVSISFLRSRLEEFGHQVGEEHYFVVTLNKQTETTEKRSRIFAASRSEIEQWPLKVVDAQRSWLPSK